MSQIIYLSKIFNQLSHAEDFMAGKIYANRLSYFRELEGDILNNRSDKHEALTLHFQPKGIEIEFKELGILITDKDLAEPVFFQKDFHNYLNIFCMYAGQTRDFTELTKENQIEFRKQLEMPEECLNLGEHLVILTDVKEFIKRIKQKVKELNFTLKGKLIEYYDSQTFHGSFNDDESIFKKRNEYQHQNEYRFVFNTFSRNNEPLVLDIGSIKDITLLLKSKDFNKGLKINFPENQE